MYDHLGLKVHDLAASIRFYQAALAPLGHVLGSHDDTYAGLGPKDAPALWLYAHPGGQPGNKGQGTHIAFRAETPAQVDAFYKAGLKAGAADNGGPGPRPDYSPTYYAAFLIDPDGNNVEAVCP
ncbi:VOC family protein [Hydrogenophaga sp.]|jgi:catechol 2,3-dioxygenase-like lactoylglutathione lyase family enzyme|uniref:VOC family protein n=1 Tax=Hydrogenophaga sp. TaxID=1904254 RepID=UPI003F70A177